MINLLITRKGEAHIIDYYTAHQSRYRTLCGDFFYKKQILNTLSLDNTFNGMCPNCKSDYDDMYLSDLNECPEIARGESYRLQDFVTFVQAGLYNPEDKYYLSLKRVWGKLSKCKNLTTRKKIYG